MGRVEAASVRSSEGTLRQVDAAPTERNAEPEKLDDGNWGSNFQVIWVALLSAFQRKISSNELEFQLF